MATPTPPIESLATARFKTVKAAEPIEVTVHFNPASLQYTVSNTLKDQGSGSKKKQYVSQTTAKLTMDLVFDTTATGEDVRETTDKMARLLQPHGPSGKQIPPLVEFGWGVYRFTGMVEQYKETLDFFAASGVPLRSGINLTLSSQDVVFESNRNPNASVDGNLTPEPVSLPAFGGAAGLAGALGDPRAARAIAAVNGAASLRFSAGASLAVGVGAGVSLAPAAAFSAGGGAGAGLSLSGGIGLGTSAGAGIGVSAGAGVGGSGGVGIGVSARVGIGASGGVDRANARAGFSGLRAVPGGALSTPDARSALSMASGAAHGTAVRFGLGGRAQSTGSASLSADVGANADLTARLDIANGQQRHE